jgi:hypothetical protein
MVALAEIQKKNATMARKIIQKNWSLWLKNSKIFVTW